MLPEYVEYLRPAQRKHVAGRVTTLLAHFFVPDMPVPLQTAVISDWLEDLAEFPPWAVEDACRMWRRTESRRPTPAVIRKICQKAVKDVEFECRILREALNHHVLRVSETTQIGTS